LLDLDTLELVATEETSGGLTFQVSFLAGDGRLYLAGDASAVDAARGSVWRRRSAHERQLLLRDIGLARRGGVDVSAAVQCVTAAAAESRPSAAYGKLAEARERLQQAEVVAREYNQVRRHVEAARVSLGQIQEAFYRAPVQPIDETSLPALRELERRVLAMGRNFSRIENGLRGGSWDPTEAYVLEREAGQLADAVRRYRPENLIAKKIVVVGWPNGTGGMDPETTALAERLRWMYSSVQLWTPEGGGAGNKNAELVDSEAPLVWSQQDLVWVHLSGRSTAVQARYCEAADLVAGVAKDTRNAPWRRYSDSGGALILSGLASCLVKELGWETSSPNGRYWGTMIVPGHGPSRHRAALPPAVSSLGIKPRDKTHAIFSGLPVEGFATMEFNAAELVSAAVWHRPRTGRTSWRAPFWPEQGRVLAGYWAAGLELAPDYAVVVEYPPRDRGRGMVVGGAFDPRVSTERVRRGKHYDRLIRNLVEYMSSAH
jgi:hypothetical protein